MTPILKDKIIKLISEFFQEMGRLYTLCLPVATPYLIKVLEVWKDTGAWTFEWRVFIAMTVIFILKSGDRALHESGLVEKGIARF